MHRRRYWKWLLVIFVLGLIAGVLLFAFKAKAQQDQYCKLIRGETTSVIGNKGLNEGAFEFERNTSFPIAYRSCAKMRMMTVIGHEMDLDGWAWNSNLGWTALGAYGDSAPYENSGVPVSNYQFRSFVKYANATTGQLRGWWWNDAMGWISLHCLDIAGQCSTSSYGGSVDADGNVTGYAWSDSVGWINLAGMKLPTADELAIVPEVNVNLIPVDGNGGELSAGSIVYASTANTGYKFEVSFDFEGNSLIDDFSFDFDLLLRDQVLARQVADTGSSLTFNDPPADRGNGSNNLLSGKLGIIDGNSTRYTEDVDVNGKKVYLSNTILKSAVPTVDYSTGDSLLDIAKLANFNATKRNNGEVTEVTTPMDLNVAVPFAAPVVTELVQREESDGLDLVLGVNKPILANINDEIALNISGQHKIVINEPADESGASNYYYCFYNNADNLEECEVETDAEGNPITPALGYDRFIQSYAGGDVSKVLNLYLDYYGSDTQKSVAETAEGTGVYSYMEGYFGTELINYVTGSLLANKLQVFEAEVKGNVRVDATRSLTQESSNLASAGLRAEKTREDYLKYAQAITRGRKHNTAYRAVCNEDSGSTVVNLSWCGVVSTDNRRVYLVQAKGAERDKPLQLSFPQVTDVDEYVVIVIGRDVIVNSNVYFETNGDLDKNKKLVLMAFKNGYGVGGNIYVKGGVTMLQANIYADGTMFSVHDTWTYDPAVIEPARTPAMREGLQNQFVLLGSLVSQNTIGGCNLDIPRLGDGRIVPDLSLGSKERACLYDLNYFRYSPMVYDSNEDKLIWPTDPSKKLAWQILNNEGVADPEGAMREAVKRPTPSDYAIVNLEYSPPPQDSNLPKLPTGFTFSN